MDAWGGSWGGAWGESWGAVDVAAPPPPFHGGPDAAGWPVLSDEDIQRQNETILLTVMAAVTQGMIR
jgi:hypothetical protein